MWANDARSVGASKKRTDRRVIVPGIAQTRRVLLDSHDVRVGIALAMFAPTFLAASASAQRTTAFAWARGPGAEACASEEAITRSVAARLGREPFAHEAGDAPSRIEGLVLRDTAGWHVEIMVRGREGETLGARHLESAAATCTSLDEAAALTIALILDPESLSRPPVPATVVEEAPEETASEPPQCVVVVPEAMVCPVPVAPSHRLLGTVALSAAGSVGLLPSPWGGVSLDASIALDPLVQLEVGLTYWPEQRGGLFGSRVGVGLTSGRLGISVPYFSEGGLTLEVAGSVQVGAMHTVIFSIEPAQPGDQLFFAADVRARARWAFAAPLALVVDVVAIIPIVRNVLRVDGGPSFWPEPVAGNLLVGLAAEFR